MIRGLLVCIALFSSCQVADDELDDDIKDCPAACANLIELGCPGAEGAPGEDEIFGTADDLTCVEVCEIITSEASGTLYPKCVSEAESCEAADACFQ